MSPVLIVALVVVGVIVLIFLFGLTPEPGRRRSPAMLKRRSRWTRWLPVIPLLGAIGCLGLAFSGFRFAVLQASPIAVLSMDVSESMEETDIAPSRLEAAQSAALSFLEELPDDVEVALVTFSREVALVVEPTTDRDAVAQAVTGFRSATGTHIWDGLDAALDAIEQRTGGDAPAAVLLMSDGRDTGSVATPDDAADRAAALQIRVYAVLLGQPEGERAADLEALEAVTGPTGGETFTAATADQLTERFRSLGTRFSVELAADPNTTPLVVAALALVLIAGIMLVYVQR